MSNDRFRDPIHGFIEVTPLEKQIIDSAPFQRLRNIKQLAMTNYIYYGAEHTRFGHSIGVMHLVTRAFDSVAAKKPVSSFRKAKKLWYRQILRLIALTHDLGHAPFSHASEQLFPNDLKHEDFTEKIIKETIISEYILKIGEEFVKNFGENYNITPDLICGIYLGTEAGENSEFIFLRTFMDSQLDCDKMDYLLRDALYCGVNYGKFDIERIILCLKAYYKNKNDKTLYLGIEYGGRHAYDEFILARYFMFLQVYFHRTRRYFDIILVKALENILPNGTYPENVEEYLQWDDNKVIELLKNKINEIKECRQIIDREVYKCLIEIEYNLKDIDENNVKISEKYNFAKQNLFKKYGKESYIEDDPSKVFYKLPQLLESESEEEISIIFDKTSTKNNIIIEQSLIINKLTERKIIKRLYCCKDIAQQSQKYLKRTQKSALKKSILI